MAALTVSTFEINDLLRASAAAWLATQAGGGSTDGQGYFKVTNLVPNGGAEINSTGCINNQASTVSRTTASAKFGTASFLATCNDNTRVMSVEWQDLAGSRLVISAGARYTFSFYCRDGGGYGKQAFARVICLDAGGATLATFTGANQNIPSNWQSDGSDRWTLTFTAPANTARVRLTWQVTTTNALNDTYYFDGVQLEASGTAHAYVETSAGSASAVQGSGDSSYGLWEAGTNLFRRGQCDSLGTANSPTDSNWSSGGSGGVMTGSIDAYVAAPFSSQSFKLVVDGANNNQGIRALTPNALGLAAGTVCVSSIYFKGTQGVTYKHNLSIHNTDGTNTDGTQQTFVATGEWQLLTQLPVAAAAGKTVDSISVYAQTTVTSTGDTMWGAHPMIQVGVNAASPYVPTTGGATSARGAARVQAPSSLLTATQGWVAMRIRIGWSDAGLTTTNLFNPRTFCWYNDVNNRFMVLYNRGGGKQWSISFVNGGVSDGVAGPALGSVNIGDYVTIVAYWSGSTIGISINGSVFTTAGGKTLPSLNAATFDIGSEQGNTQLNGAMLWFMCGKGTLTNADAATLNALGNTDPALGLLGAAAQTSMVWAANTAIDNSYVDAPNTNDLAGNGTINAPGMVYNLGGGTLPASGTATGAGTLLSQGGGSETATGTLTGAGVVYDLGGEPLFADSALTDGGSLLVQGGTSMVGTSTWAGSGDLVRPSGPRLRGRVSRSRAGTVRNP